MSFIGRNSLGIGMAVIISACRPVFALPPGFYLLGELPGGEVHSHGYALSADGSVIVGVGSTPAEESFRWTADDGMIAIAPSGSAWGVSEDGTVVVGESQSQAYRWTEAAVVGLGDLPGGGFSSFAFDVSADGKVVVGHGASFSGTEAFRWTASTGMLGLGDLAGGPFHSEARGVSEDGSIIIGFGQSASGQEAFRWTVETGMVGLGDLPGGGFFSSATDVSADGTIIVGHSRSAAFGSEPFVWDADHGMRSLRTMLGLDFSDFVFLTTEGVSDDGTTLIGRVRHPDGTNEAWIAVLPEPSTLVVFVLGGLWATHRRPDRSRRP